MTGTFFMLFVMYHKFSRLTQGNQHVPTGFSQDRIITKYIYELDKIWHVGLAMYDQKTITPIWWDRLLSLIILQEFWIWITINVQMKTMHLDWGPLLWRRGPFFIRVKKNSLRRAWPFGLHSNQCFPVVPSRQRTVVPISCLLFSWNAWDGNRTELLCPYLFMCLFIKQKLVQTLCHLSLGSSVSVSCATSMAMN